MRTHLPVSVIIPLFNAKLTIFRAIDSIIQQSRKPAEVIIVDDASNDRTSKNDYLKKIESILKKNYIKTIIIKNKINQGPAFSRNEGWKKATQKYIAFLDADDSWAKHKLNFQFYFMKNNNNLDATCHDTKFLNNDQNDLKNIKVDKSVKGRIVYLIELFFKNKIQTRTVMIKKNLVERFDPKIRYSEDLDLWLRLIFNKKKIYYIDEKLAFCFKYPMSKHSLSSHYADFWKSEINVLAKNSYRSFLILLLPLIITFSYIKFLTRILGLRDPKNKV